MERKTRRNITKILIAIGIVILLYLAQYGYQTYIKPYFQHSDRQVVTLYKCVDGDTAWFIMNGEKVKSRFLYIDTPESTNKKEYLGKEASEYTKNQLENATTIEVEFNEDGDQYDKYNRALLWVFVDGELLQEKIAREGYCKKYYDYGCDYKYKNEIIKADREAKRNHVGLYK